MKRVIFTVLILFAIFSSGAGEFPRSITQFIDKGAESSSYEIDNEYLHSGNILSLFYESRNCSPAWFTQDILNNNGFALLDYIHDADQHGLKPEDYHLHLIEKYIKKYIEKVTSFTPWDSVEMMKLDLLLTDAFMTLGSNLYFGKVDPEKCDSSWKMQRKDMELRLDFRLKDALLSNDIVIGLNNLAPKYRSYWKMKEELAFFLNLNDQSWPALMSEMPIRPGDTNLLLPKIRERLISLRYPVSDSISIIFDDELGKQLKLFQDDWGLNTDGVIGKTTLEDLNNLPCNLISQLKVNMERFRWLPLQVTEKHVIINIANFRLDLISGTDTLISMRAIVGKEQRGTPVFNDRISYIVFSPSWTVPQTILLDDVIPELLKGPEYLEKMNMKLLRNDGSELVYSDIDWTSVSRSNFPYTVRQNPGSGNALGRVKFMFPNTYDVYIHDTPSRGTFARDNRAVSSGCVRVEKPFDLAVLLLSDSPEWTPANIRSAMDQDKEQTVLLKIPVDVMLIYLTAWTDGNDRLQFRKDIYQRDAMLLEALNN
jgi:murein L,D-transpeptidase YcbB/YkuD